LCADEFVVVLGFVAFEVGRTAEDTVVGKTGFSLVAEFIGSDRSSIRVDNVLGGASVDNVNGVGMSMMEEGTAKTCSVKKSVGGVMDFSPFGFTDAIHFLVLGC
jgi:hypothetical protein